MKIVTVVVIIIVACALTFSIVGCPLYCAAAFKYDTEKEGGGGEDTVQKGANPQQILTNEEQIILGWNPSPSSPDEYKVLFRIHDTSEWFILNQIIAEPDPQFTVEYDDLFGNNPYDFGVIAVDSEARESTTHTSLDVTADPDTGWYLIWER